MGSESESASVVNLLLRPWQAGVRPRSWVTALAHRDLVRFHLAYAIAAAAAALRLRRRRVTELGSASAARPSRTGGQYGPSQSLEGWVLYNTHECYIENLNVM